MAEKACVKRLQKEFKALCKEPAPHVVARPLPNNIFECYYILEGSEGSPFAGGYYYGKIKFPPDYPFSPPGISILTGLLSFMMDSSPTTGSVTTTVTEKQHLAKASLAFNCKNPTFRKVFPEYVEICNQQQQLTQQTGSTVSPTPAPENDPKLQKTGNVLGNLEAEVNKKKRNNRRQLLLIWLLLLLCSIFGLVMALPLLQP